MHNLLYILFLTICTTNLCAQNTFKAVIKNEKTASYFSRLANKIKHTHMIRLLTNTRNKTNTSLPIR